MNKTFIQFLESEHARNYTGCDDDMPDAFNAWLADQSIESLLEYAELAVADGLGIEFILRL